MATISTSARLVGVGSKRATQPSGSPLSRNITACACRYHHSGTVYATASLSSSLRYRQQRQQNQRQYPGALPTQSRNFSFTTSPNSTAHTTKGASAGDGGFSGSGAGGAGSDSGSEQGSGSGWSDAGSSFLSPNSGNSPLSPFASLTSQLDEIAPRFEIDADAIRVVKGPVEFYELLKTKILTAKRRIYLSTLYFGPKEQDLVDTIAKALRQNPDLKISILTDALRGTRETPKQSCASLLAPLVKEFGAERVQIRMFHTPNLTGLRKRIVPRRFNEGWGLQHMKMYGFDDEIIMSGANLSGEYFHNRQDRYHLLKSKELTEYYEKIHNAISSISYEVTPPLSAEDKESGYTIAWPASNKGPAPIDNPKGYTEYATELVGPLIGPGSRQPSSSPEKPRPRKSNTVIYPVFQLEQLLPSENPNPKKPLSFESTEIRAVTTVLLALRELPFRPASLTFTAGYFNPSPSLVSLILSTNPASVTALAASPYANGFYGSRGVSGMLPDAYTLLGRRFLEQAQKRGLYKDGTVQILEWRRGWGKQDPPLNTVIDAAEKSWTYHAKGMWITLPPLPGAATNTVASASPTGAPASGPGPAITLVGSSNYTARSAKLDLEANALIITQDPSLQRRLAEEEAWLRAHATRMELDDYMRTERRVSWRVRLAMRIVEAVGGAL